MSTHSGWWLRSSKTLGFLVAFLLVLAGTSQNPRPVSAAELYPADFDPLQDLPLPPAWGDTEGFATTLEALRDQVATAGKARVRVDLRLPAVEPDRLDEAQSAQWEQDQAAARADLLDALPDGSYRRLDEGPEVKSLIRAGTGTGVADEAPNAVDDPTAFDWPADANAVKPPPSAVAATSLSLEVGEVALDGLMDSALVAEVQAISAGNARIAAYDYRSFYIGSDGNLWAWGNYVTTPTQILTGVAAMAAGEGHTSPSRPTAASGPGAITVMGNWAMGRPPTARRLSRS
ncbi:MAG: hypothetical protein WBJ41_08760 [Chromatiaceae bacterium]